MTVEREYAWKAESTEKALNPLVELRFRIIEMLLRSPGHEHALQTDALITDARQVFEFVVDPTTEVRTGEVT